ncbi:MAG: DUF4442 domain-containing protein [Lysobacter sp.]
MKARTLRHVLNLWPPFLFSGVHVTALADDYRHARVELRMRPWNRNYVGTHFGGSLFAMTDPFWMLLTLQSLGREYIVWDQAGAIDFLKPGRGTVHARFDLDDATLDELRNATIDGAKTLCWFETDVIDAAGDMVARMRKQLYIRRKPGRSAGDATAQSARGRVPQSADVPPLT